VVVSLDMAANDRLAGPGDPQGQGHVLARAQVFDKPEILKHDPKAPADIGDLGAGQGFGIPTEHAHPPPCRHQRQIDHPQQRGFPGPALAGQKVKAIGFKLETDVLKDRRTVGIAHFDVFEAYHRIRPFEVAMDLPGAGRDRRDYPAEVSPANHSRSRHECKAPRPPSGIAGNCKPYGVMISRRYNRPG
jgi:hypothetical protein